MNKTTIKTNLFRVRYRRDDGSKQLKVLAKIGYQADSKFNELRRFEISIRDKFNNLYPVTDHKYEKLKALPPSIERLFLFQIETKIKRIILELIEEGKDFTTKDIKINRNSGSKLYCEKTWDEWQWIMKNIRKST